MNDLPQFLYQIRPNRMAMLTEGPTDAEAAILGQHVQFLTQKAEEGVVILAGRTQTADPDTFGIVIFSAESPEAAEQIMQSDPAVNSGVMAAKLYPYQIAVQAK